MKKELIGCFEADTPLDLTYRASSTVEDNKTTPRVQSNASSETNECFWSPTKFLSSFLINNLNILYFIGFVNKECDTLREALLKAAGMDLGGMNRLSPNGTDLTATESVVSDSGIDTGSTPQSETSSIWPSPSNFLSPYSMLGSNGIQDLHQVLKNDVKLSPKKIRNNWRNHKIEEDGLYSCDQCDKTFGKQSSLARHKYEHSGNLISHLNTTVILRCFV